MTARDLAALLRADPDRAARAIELAKVAGPWTFQSDGVDRGRWTRAWCGRVAANDEAKVWHDADLRRRGWVLPIDDASGARAEDPDAMRVTHEPDPTVLRFSGDR